MVIKAQTTSINELMITVITYLRERVLRLRRDKGGASLPGTEKASTLRPGGSETIFSVLAICLVDFNPGLYELLLLSASNETHFTNLKTDLESDIFTRLIDIFQYPPE